MTDRVKGFTVALDKDIRIDDIEHIINAIKMVKGVSDVQPLITDSGDFIARVRVRQEFIAKMFVTLDTMT